MTGGEHHPDTGAPRDPPHQDAQHQDKHGRDTRRQGTHQQLRELLGVHALGHLSGAEETAIRAHLDGCPGCRTELAEIAGLRAALTGIDPERLASPSSPPPWLGERVRRLVADERTARGQGAATWARSPVLAALQHPTRLLAVAAAVVLLVGIGGVLLGRATAPTPGSVAGDPVAAKPVPWEQVALRVVGQRSVSISDAGLVPHTWGVELRFTGAGFEEGEVYRATFMDGRGRPTPAGEFLGTGAAEMECHLQAAILRPRVTAVVISDASGETVLSADL